MKSIKPALGGAQRGLGFQILCSFNYIHRPSWPWSSIQLSWPCQPGCKGNRKDAPTPASHGTPRIPASHGSSLTLLAWRDVSLERMAWCGWRKASEHSTPGRPLYVWCLIGGNHVVSPLPHGREGMWCPLIPEGWAVRGGDKAESQAQL